MLTAEEILESARDYSPLFTRQNAPDMGALKALSRFQKELAAAVVEENPDALAVWHDIVFADLPVDLDDGIEIPEHLIVVGAEIWYDSAVSQQEPQEVVILSPGQTRTQPHMYPSIYLMNRTLYLADLRVWYGTLHGWEDMSRLRLRIVPEIAELGSLTTPITLPDSAESALVANLALWMADRVGAKLSTLRASAEASAASWVRSTVNLGSTRTWLVEVVE